VAWDKRNVYDQQRQRLEPRVDNADDKVPLFSNTEKALLFKEGQVGDSIIVFNFHVRIISVTSAHRRD